MIIHIHSTLVPNSGELKRMNNIDLYVTNLLGTNSVEVVTYPFSRRKDLKKYSRFNLSENVIKKYYIPAFPLISRVLMNFFFLFLVLRFKPSCIIGEMVIPYKYFWIIKRLFPQIKIVFDIHGALAEEAEYQGKGADVVARYRNLEKNEVSHVDYLICQSDEMKRYLIHQYGVDGNKVCVFRCGVDTSMFHINDEARSSIRKELGIDDNTILFCYSGGLHPWQRVKDSLLIFESYHKGNPKSKMLVLTGDQLQLKTMVEELGVDNTDGHILCKTLPFELVSNYLNACDLAFLLRHNHVMNAVASPTKLAEYMSCGLPVITSEVAKKWVDKEGGSFFIMEDKASDCEYVLQKLKSIHRNDVSAYASCYFSLDVDNQALAGSLQFFN